MTKTLQTILCLALFSVGAASAQAQGTAFTYQGQLSSGGAPANGLYDLRFALFDASIAGAQQGLTRTNSATPVTNGLFTVTLDFGNQFPGAARWLELGVRTNGAGAFDTLAPRQALAPTPYAIFSGNAGTVSGSVPATQITGTIPLGQLPAVVVTNGGTFTGNGSGLTNLSATNLAGTIADGRLSSNVPLLNGTNGFTGTNRFSGAVIATNANNQLTGTFIGNGGGITNINSSNLTATIADSRLSTNVALRSGGNVFKGGQTFESGAINVFGTGLNGSTFQKFVLYADTANGMLFEAPLDGSNNKLPYKFSWRGSSTAVVIGTNGNFGIGSTTPGARLSVNETSDVAVGTFAGLSSKLALQSNPSSFDLVARTGNDIGYQNLHLRAGAGYGVWIGTGGNVGIGTPTPASLLDVRRPDNAGGDSIAFGSQTGDMGRLGEDTAILGNNVYLNNVRGTLDGSLDFRLGGASQMVIRGNGTSSNVGIGTTTPDTQLTISRAGGGAIALKDPQNDPSGYWAIAEGGINNGWFAVLRYNSNRTFAGTGFGMDPAGNFSLYGGEISCTAINLTSDRNAKENFKNINAREVLEKVAHIPITEWQYKTEKSAAGTRHIGPMAQDFHKTFGVGPDEKHITSVDADGVALAAIQGLNEKVEERDARINELEKTVKELKGLVSKLVTQQSGGGK